VSEFSVGIGPLVPDAYSVLLKVADVGVAFQEPQEFVDYRFQMCFLCGHQGEAVGEVETHLISEYGTRAGAGAV
jgi:hypothetical protein